MSILCTQTCETSVVHKNKPTKQHSPEHHVAEKGKQILQPLYSDPLVPGTYLWRPVSLPECTPRSIQPDALSLAQRLLRYDIAGTSYPFFMTESSRHHKRRRRSRI